MPNVSFVIPAYNAAPWLEQAVRSVLDGNWRDGDQLIVVDDASTDDTPRVLAGLFESTRDRVAAFDKLTHGRNLGCGESRNAGNRLARHDWIYALDADNLLPPGTRNRLFDELMVLRPGDRDGVDALAPAEFRFFRGDPSNVTGRWHNCNLWVTLPVFLSRHNLPTSGMNYLYRRRLWEKVPHAEGVGALEAWTWGLRIMMAGASLWCVPDTYYLHRQGIDSLWIRENKTKDFDAVATEQMRPYLDRLVPADAAYVTAKGSKWYTNLNKRPLRSKNGLFGT